MRCTVPLPTGLERLNALTVAYLQSKSTFHVAFNGVQIPLSYSKRPTGVSASLATPTVSPPNPTNDKDSNE